MTDMAQHRHRGLHRPSLGGGTPPPRRPLCCGAALQGTRPRRRADRDAGAGRSALHDRPRGAAGIPDELSRSCRSTLSGENIDTADPGKSNFDAVVRDAIDAMFPFATERADRRAARGLLSDAAGIILREQVLDDPSLIGGTQRVALPFSDTVDLYLKGLIVEPEPLTVAGPATPSAASGEVIVQLDREATARVRADLSATLRVQAGRLSREASRTAIQAEGQDSRSRTAADQPGGGGAGCPRRDRGRACSGPGDADARCRLTSNPCSSAPRSCLPRPMHRTARASSPPTAPRTSCI